MCNVAYRLGLGLHSHSQKVFLFPIFYFLYSNSLNAQRHKNQHYDYVRTPDDDDFRKQRRKKNHFTIISFVLFTLKYILIVGVVDKRINVARWATSSQSLLNHVINR